MTSNSFGTGNLEIQAADGTWQQFPMMGITPARADAEPLRGFNPSAVITGYGSMEIDDLAGWVALDQWFGGPPPRPANRIGGRPETYRFDLCENASRIAINSATGFKS